MFFSQAVPVQRSCSARLRLENGPTLVAFEPLQLGDDVNQRSALFRSTIPLGSNPGARKDRLQFGSSANELAARYGINPRTLGERSQSPMPRGLESTLMQAAYTCRPKIPLHACLGQCQAGVFFRRGF